MIYSGIKAKQTNQKLKSIERKLKILEHDLETTLMILHMRSIFNERRMGTNSKNQGGWDQT